MRNAPPLTQKTIEKAKAGPSGRLDLPDPSWPGLHLRVTPSGAKSFRYAVYEGPARKLRWVTLGPWSYSPTAGHVTLAEAHSWCERLKAANLTGDLPRVKAQLGRAVAPEKHSPNGDQTLDGVASDFWKVLDAQRKRGHGDAKAIYDKHIKSTIGHLGLKQIKRSHCVAIAEASRNRVAKVLGTMKQLLDFAERRGNDDEFTNPAARLKAGDFGARNKKRKRWLDEKEIAAFWLALEPDTNAVPETVIERRKMAAALRLLLLTGLRTGELRQARWSAVDLEAKTFTVPVAHQKLTPKQAEEAVDFVVPLGPSAITLFEELKTLSKGSPFVLASVTSTTGIYDDKSLGRFTRRLWVGEKAWGAKHPATKGHPALVNLESASPHDLRRTCRTWLGKLGVAPHICERVLNHRLGRIVETYDRHDYLDARRAALELWDAEIERITRIPLQPARHTSAQRR